MHAQNKIECYNKHGGAATNAQLKFVMTECSKTHFRLTGLIWSKHVCQTKCMHKTKLNATTNTVELQQTQDIGIEWYCSLPTALSLTSVSAR